MTIGFHSPLPPARTGVADYSAALLRELSRRANVSANPDSPRDVELYHLGNNQLHRSIYDRALAKPGVVVLHDAVLQHFFLGQLDEAAYVDEFVHNYGEWTRELAGELYRNRARSAQGPEYFRYPMIRRVVERSLAVVVHNPAAARMVRLHAPQVHVVEIPHLWEETAAPPAYEIERRRKGRFVFGVFGHLRESKQLMLVLRVFERLYRADPTLALVVAGPFASSDLARAVAADIVKPGVRRVEYLPEPEFLLEAHAVDCCVNLREPPAGETSGIAIRLMGIGKPVIVTAGEEVERIPESACVRIAPGLETEEALCASMLWLSTHPDQARAMGAAAAAYIRREHSLAGVAEKYLDTLARAAR